MYCVHAEKTHTYIYYVHAEKSCIYYAKWIIDSIRSTYMYCVDAEKSWKRLVFIINSLYCLYFILSNLYCSYFILNSLYCLPFKIRNIPLLIPYSKTNNRTNNKSTCVPFTAKARYYSEELISIRLSLMTNTQKI